MEPFAPCAIWPRSHRIGGKSEWEMLGRRALEYELARPVYLMLVLAEQVAESHNACRGCLDAEAIRQCVQSPTN